MSERGETSRAKRGLVFTDPELRPGWGGHSPWFWVPTAKRTPGAVAVGSKRGGCHRPLKNSQKGAVRGAFPVGAVVVSLASQR